jgi:hypothetical protein
LKKDEIMTFLRVLLVAGLLLNVSRSAWAEQAQINVDDYVIKMKTDLNLTEEQARAVKKVFKAGLAKQKEIEEGQQTEDGNIDRDDVNRELKKLKEQQMQQLSRILTHEQMQKWINKQTVKNMLNRDKTDFSDSLYGGATISPGGANFNF